MDKWYDGLPVLDRNKLSKNKGINDILVKDLEENEIVLAKATFNRFVFYLMLFIVIGLFIWCIKIYKNNNNETDFKFLSVLTIGIAGLVYLLIMLQTYILITNERLVASVAEANSLNVIKLIIPLRNIDNLVYDAGIQLKVMSKSNAYSIFTNSEDIELVRKTYYAYTQFKEKNETRELELKVNPPSTVSNTNKYDEIEKLSELFKKGIITQEEFDKKKTELLGL
jgi:hypothetical protein